MMIYFATILQIYTLNFLKCLVPLQNLAWYGAD